MQTIVDSTCRASLTERLSRLSPESKPRWGSFNAHGMVCHLADQLGVALGIVKAADRSSFAKRTLAKWVVLYLPIPVPRGKIKTAPEMLSSKPDSWDEDIETVKSRLVLLAEADSVGRHPTFGPLSHAQWSLLAAKHMDHHLRQFGG